MLWFCQKDTTGGGGKSPNPLTKTNILALINDPLSEQ